MLLKTIFKQILRIFLSNKYIKIKNKNSPLQREEIKLENVDCPVSVMLGSSKWKKLTNSQKKEEKNNLFHVRFRLSVMNLW